MYEVYYGLQERPFELTPNPRFLFLSPHHREALSTLEYGLSSRTGIAVLLGDAGTGKTTLVHAALQARSTRQSLVVYLNNPSLTRGEFIEFLAAGFGLSAEAARSKTRCLSELTDLLASRHLAKQMSALVIDEAQCLPDSLLEEIRLLANIESACEKLISIVLAGQPELADRLNQPSLRQLKQRIGLRCTLHPLNAQEAAHYIASRIRSAGGRIQDVFLPEAVDVVYDRSGGIPRTMSVICDNALVTGFALDRRPIDADVVAEVCRDFDFHSALSAAADAATQVMNDTIG